MLVIGRCALGVSVQDGVPDASVSVREGFGAALAGPLDNADQLRLELGVEPGCTPSDLVAEAFRAWGDQAPNRMRGVFGAVVTNGRDLWCFQDHFALGHVYYRDEPAAFYAATEPKQVVAGAGIPKEPDLGVVEALFYSDLQGDIERELTCAVKGVRRLPKATVMSLSGGVLQGRRYWQPEDLFESGRYSRGELQERFDELMRQAVARTLTGKDVVSLSGGVDSPAIAAFASTLRTIGALSTVFPDYPSVDETRYVELIAERLDIPLHTYVATSRPLDDIDHWARVLDSPAPVIPPAQMAEHHRQARKLGYRTMLSGEHAEAVFDSHRYLIAHLLWRGRLPALFRYVREQRSLGRRSKGIARELASALVPRPLRAALWRRRSTREEAAPSWIDVRRVTERHLRWVGATRHRWRDGQLAASLGTGIGSEASEICEAVSGIQVRYPWADVDLYEFFLSLPAGVKFPYPSRGGKALVRELLRNKVPEEILDRKDKTVFNDYYMSGVEYGTLRRLLIEPEHRIAGVRYDVLAGRLQEEHLTLAEVHWALELAKTHAFLSQW
ncbi:MAG TPA: asparagine synthase-related protein [Acidimicrobiales bacterium]|nr:asparagine synthase-related protein [Acidimicrobiales bacterium]